MTDLYMFATPNCWKASIMLEEAGVPYTVKWINLRERQNVTPEFLAKCPIAKVPYLDDDGIGVYSSAAILLYVAEKTGKLMPKSGKPRAEALEWLMFALTDLTNSWVYRNRFKNMLPEKDAYAIELFEKDHARILAHAEKRLADRAFLCGEFSAADIAAFPQVGGPYRDKELLKAYPNLTRWADAIEARPAVKRGLRTSAA